MPPRVIGTKSVPLLFYVVGYLIPQVILGTVLIPVTAMVPLRLSEENTLQLHEGTTVITPTFKIQYKAALVTEFNITEF